MAADITLTQECIKATSNYGSTIYTNICTGDIHTIAWGGNDYLSFYVGWGAVGLGILFALALISMFTAMAISVFSNG